MYMLMAIALPALGRIQSDLDAAMNIQSDLDEASHTDFTDRVTDFTATRSVAADGAEIPAEIVVVFSMQRSASTSVALSIGAHACSISFNEVIATEGGNALPQGFPESERDCLAAASPCRWITPLGCQSAVWRNRFDDPLAALLAARESWCGRPRAPAKASSGSSIFHTSSPWPNCGSDCVVVVKIHAADIPSIGQRSRYAALLRYKGTRVVLLERRNIVAKYCSLQFSSKTGNYHNDASKSAIELKEARAFKKAWQAEHCPTVVPPSYAEFTREWYEWGRKTMREADRTWLEITTEEYVQDPKSSEATLHAFAGLPAQQYRGACNGNGCNCEYESV